MQSRLPVPARDVELPLRPSRRLRAALWVLRLIVVAYVLELLLGRHWLMAPVVALIAATGWMCARNPGARSLRQEAGRLFLVCDGGRAIEVRVAAGGMRVGPYVLLVLHSALGTHRLLLGPDNLAAAELAALLRGLPGGTASPATALHSVKAAGSRLSAPP